MLCVILWKFIYNKISIWSKAAKRINKLSEGFQYAKKELETLKQINSDYIVKYLGFEEDPTNLYVIMKLYEVIDNFKNQK